MNKYLKRKLEVLIGEEDVSLVQFKYPDNSIRLAFMDPDRILSPYEVNRIRERVLKLNYER